MLLLWTAEASRSDGCDLRHGAVYPDANLQGAATRLRRPRLFIPERNGIREGTSNDLGP